MKECEVRIAKVNLEKYLKQENKGDVEVSVKSSKSRILRSNQEQARVRSKYWKKSTMKDALNNEVDVNKEKETDDEVSFPSYPGTSVRGYKRFRQARVDMLQ